MTTADVTWQAKIKIKLALIPEFLFDNNIKTFKKRRDILNWTLVFIIPDYVLKEPKYSLYSL